MNQYTVIDVHLRKIITKMMIRFAFYLLLWSCFQGCTNEPVDLVIPEQPVVSMRTKEMKIDILCLGDSYTKGESVPTSQNFPNQLKDSLLLDTFDLLPAAPHIIAQTGWRTDQLINAIFAATEIQDSIFSLVTLCIGVNNQYQNGNLEQYKTQFEALLKTAIIRAGNRKKRVIVVSIPDWAFTIYGQNYPGGGASVSAKIDEYNAANKVIADQYQVHYVNVTGSSRQGITRPELVAIDGLHPSAVQYSEWVRLILPVAKAVLVQ